MKDWFVGVVMPRGLIQNMARFKQVISFENMKFGTITPTDIDGAIEYKNKAYIFIEVKYRDKELPFGQRLALERLVQDTGVRKKSLAIICEHNIENEEDSIIIADCIVRELYLSEERKWRALKGIFTTKDLVDLFIRTTVEKTF